MWLSTVLSALMLTSFCLAASHQQFENDQEYPVEAREKGSNKYPWLVAIFAEGKNELVNPPEIYRNKICGGVLIKPHAVLTLATCSDRAIYQHLVLRFGLSGDSDDNSQQERRVKHIIRHENYNPRTLANDYAILILNEPVDLDSNVRPVRLPLQNELFHYSKCFTPIREKNNCGKPQVEVKNLAVMNSKVCQNTLAAHFNRPITLHSSFICTARKDDDDAEVCKANEGVPLICNQEVTPSANILAGIKSSNEACSFNVKLYSNVASVRDWIDAKLSQH